MNYSDFVTTKFPASTLAVNESIWARTASRWRQTAMWLLAFVSLALFQATALAEIAANASFVSGVVTATASAKPERSLEKGSDIFSGDTINTAENGRIQMRFTDGGLVSLMPRTTFSIDEYLHEDSAPDDGSLVFGMLRGGMRTITGSIGKIQHEQYELKTPVATLGIRGTEYVAVLNPPNTLRVHVGKGKVVITNDQGSLEVPEGRNAVVTLGGAPEFSDTEPQYLATGIGGDMASVQGLIDEDPYLMEPTLDLPTDFVAAPVNPTPTPPTPIPPTPPSAIPPSGPGYLMAGYAEDSSATVSGFSSGGATFTALFDQTTGAVDVAGAPNTNAAGMTTSNVGYLAGNISWGEFNGGSGGGTLFGVPVGPGRIASYVIGSEVQNMPTTGVLTYQLAGATPAYNHDNATVGTLNSFDLSINLLGSSYNFNMGLTMPNVTYGASGGGAFNSPDENGFSLSSNTVNMNGNTCSICSFSASGFLAGPNAEQAGVNYMLGENTNIITGAAALTRP